MSTTDSLKPLSHRSEEYLRLIEELKSTLTSAADIADKLYNQGKCDGLDNDTIRKDIETALVGVVKSRQLRNIMPLDLKRKYTYANSAMIAKLKLQSQQATDSISKAIPTPTQAQQAIAFKQQFSGNSNSKSYEQQKTEIEVESGLDKSVNDSLLHSVPQEYKIELLDQYDKPYLIKIVKYQHTEITYLRTILHLGGNN